MKRFGLCLMLVALQACVSAADKNEITIAAPISSDAYAACAACHLADGAGVPGAFPALRNRVAAIAGLDGGQEFLIAVASFGLMGQIEVGGVQYFGIMPGNKGPMTNEEIAAALNYVIFELVDDKGMRATIDPITADNVAAVQSETKAGSPAIAAAARKQLLARYGEKWP